MGKFQIDKKMGTILSRIAMALPLLTSVNRRTVIIHHLRKEGLLRGHLMSGGDHRLLVDDPHPDVQNPFLIDHLPLSDT